MKKSAKRALTLMELMIVILIIGIIGSVVSYSMRGTLDKAKAFKTEQGAKKLYELALLGLEEQGLSLADAVSIAPSQQQQQQGQQQQGQSPTTTGVSYLRENIHQVLQQLGLTQNVDMLMKDGWGEYFTSFSVQNGSLTFSSVRYENYCNAQKIRTRYPWQQ